MKELPISQGLTTHIDDNLYEILCQWKWQNAKGYVARDKRGTKTKIYLHNVVYDLTYSNRLGRRIDHKDRNPLNNQVNNLRVCDQTLNVFNSGPRSNNTSGYKGVGQTKGRGWQATITIDGKATHLGFYSTPEEAARVYDKAALKQAGEFAYQNFPNENQA